jgi:hypothetical protein
MPVVIETLLVDKRREKKTCHNVGSEPFVHFRFGVCNIHVVCSDQNLQPALLQCLESIVDTRKPAPQTSGEY